jgi:hypothetical protein
MPMIVQNKGDKGNPYHDEEGKFTTADDVTDGEHTIRISNPLRLERIIDGQPSREKTELEKHYEEFKNRKNVKSVTEMSQEELLSEIKVCNDFLVQKGIDLKKFKDSFAGDLKLKCANFRQMKRIMEKYPVDLNGCEFVNSNYYSSESGSQAYMGSKLSVFIGFKPNLKMNFNAKFFSSYEKVLSSEKDCGERGIFMKCTDDGYLTQTFTHEYGHALFNSVVQKNNIFNEKILADAYAIGEMKLKTVNYMGRKWYFYRGKRVPYTENKRMELIQKYAKPILLKEENKFYEKIKNEVFECYSKMNPSIINKKQEFDSDSSLYARKGGVSEWLAEMFASLEGGKPTKAALALGEWLKRNGHMKGE